MASAWALIVDDGQILLLQRAAKTSRPFQWCLPGGGIKSGETEAEACIREVHEETGLVVEIETRLARFKDAVYFQCRLETNRSNLKLPPKECQAAVWSAPHEILEVGQIMDLTRLFPLLLRAGLRTPPVPDQRGQASLFAKFKEIKEA